MEIINNTMGRIDIYMEKIFSNRYYSSIITLVLILYTSVIAPKLPNSILKLFDYSIFRVLILSLVLYYGNKNTKLSIIIAVGFIISMNLLSKRKMFENFTELQPDLEQTDSSIQPLDSNELDQNPNLVNTSSEPPSEPQPPSQHHPSSQPQPPSQHQPSSQPPSIQSPSNQHQPPSHSETPSESPQPNMVNSPEEQNDNLSSEEITHEKEKGETCNIVGNKSNCLKNLYCDPSSRKCRKKMENEACNILDNDSDDCDDVLYCDKKTKLCKRI